MNVRRNGPAVFNVSWLCNRVSSYSALTFLYNPICQTMDPSSPLGHRYLSHQLPVPWHWNPSRLTIRKPSGAITPVHSMSKNPPKASSRTNTKPPPNPMIGPHYLPKLEKQKLEPRCQFGLEALVGFPP